MEQNNSTITIDVARLNRPLATLHARNRISLFCMVLAASFTALASVPIEWVATPRNPAPATFERRHGETLDFRCTLAGFGELPFADTSDIRLWYQTNGMGQSWWSVPASFSSNVLFATFQPQDDPGTDRISLFFGAPSNAYISANLRLLPSPGFIPNLLPPPDVISWHTALEEIRSEIVSATNHVLAEALSADMTTNDVCNIVTNEVESWSFIPPSVLISGDWKQIYGVYDEGLEVWNFYAGSVEYDLGMGAPLGVTTITADVSTDLGEITVVGTASFKNALGLARLVDLPPLTNSLPATYQSKAAMTNYYTIAESRSNLLTRAEAEAGYTEWICDPPLPDGVELRWFDNGEGDTGWAPKNSSGDFIGNYHGTTNSVDLWWDNMEWDGRYSFRATRHLITPTKTSQLINDGDGRNEFVTAAITNGCLPKTGGTIYDDYEGIGKLEIGVDGTTGRLDIKGDFATLNVGGSGVQGGVVVANIGGLGTPSTLTVGGTNVMDYIASNNGLILSLSNKVAQLEAMLSGLENALHFINTGTNLLNNGSIP